MESNEKQNPTEQQQNSKSDKHLHTRENDTENTNQYSEEQGEDENGEKPSADEQD